MVFLTFAGRVLIRIKNRTLWGFRLFFGILVISSMEARDTGDTKML